MKCPFCDNRPNMVKRTRDHDNWWECPQCHKTIGKKEGIPDDETKEKAQAYDILMGNN